MPAQCLERLGGSLSGRVQGVYRACWEAHFWGLLLLAGQVSTDDVSISRWGLVSVLNFLVDILSGGQSIGLRGIEDWVHRKSNA
eukprot:1138746-Pelagomonas_calceolata.AAC.3